MYSYSICVKTMEQLTEDRSKNLYSQSKRAGQAREFAARQGVLTQPYLVYGKEKQRSMATKDPPGRCGAIVNTGSKFKN